nr:MAG TPA: hypothetical protein [Caudoviricetes sp.]
MFYALTLFCTFRKLCAALAPYAFSCVSQHLVAYAFFSLTQTVFKV